MFHLPVLLLKELVLVSRELVCLGHGLGTAALDYKTVPFTQTGQIFLQARLLNFTVTQRQARNNNGDMYVGDYICN